MTHSAVTHVQLVRMLYKSLLRLHRGLPSEMRVIGDQYVRDEFRRHKNANAKGAQLFLSEWMNYGTQLSRQLGLRGSLSESKLGATLTEEQLEHFNEGQLGQLFELYSETTKMYNESTKKPHS